MTTSTAAPITDARAADIRSSNNSFTIDSVYSRLRIDEFAASKSAYSWTIHFLLRNHSNPLVIVRDNFPIPIISTTTRTWLVKVNLMTFMISCMEACVKSHVLGAFLKYVYHFLGVNTVEWYRSLGNQPLFFTSILTHWVKHAYKNRRVIHAYFSEK